MDVMMPLLFMMEKRTEGDGWKISSRQCGIRYRRSGGKHGRKYAVCRDRSSGNGYGEAGFESGTRSRKRADRIEGAGN
mgnify:CR=1 FL=1